MGRYVYRCVDLRVWSDERVRRLSRPPPNGRDVWLYLLTAKESCIIPGVILAGSGAMADTLRWSAEGFREAFAEVSREGMAKADWEAQLVWVPNAPAYNPPTSPNVVKAWGKAWDGVPECRLKVEVFQALRVFCEGLGKAFLDAFDESFTKPSPNQEQEQELQKTSSSGAACAAPAEQGPLFAQPETPKASRPRPTNAVAEFVAWALEARTRALPGSVGDEKPNWGNLGPKLAELLREHGRKQAEAAYTLFLADGYAKGCSPPCPLALFAAKWPRWVDEANKKQVGATAPGQPGRIRREDFSEGSVDRL